MKWGNPIMHLAKLVTLLDLSLYINQDINKLYFIRFGCRHWQHTKLTYKSWAPILLLQLWYWKTLWGYNGDINIWYFHPILHHIDDIRVNICLSNFQILVWVVTNSTFNQYVLRDCQFTNWSDFAYLPWKQHWK